MRHPRIELVPNLFNYPIDVVREAAFMGAFVR